jgi:hypothetical protein
LTLNPVGPVFLFDESGVMDIVYDPALADETLETCGEFYKGFDARARPIEVRGEPGSVYFVLAAEDSRESEFRQRVTYYYARFATRTPGPPQGDSLSAFVGALAADEINE